MTENDPVFGDQCEINEEVGCNAPSDRLSTFPTDWMMLQEVEVLILSLQIDPTQRGQVRPTG